MSRARGWSLSAASGRYARRFRACRWEIAHDGVAWEHDFDLTYTRVR